jgi:myo-inositol-1(or 4)-monophosphatase
MKWNPPNQNNKILTLPKIQKTTLINFDNIETAESKATLDVSSEFLECWESTPKDINSKQELCERLQIIGDTLSQLTKLGHSPSTSQKTAPHDMVTLFDEGLEMIIRIWLQKQYPHHKIIGEEGAKHEINTDDVVWFIDPIDGTANFVKNLDTYTIHIGCIKNSEPYVSYVSIPEKNIVYCDYKKSKRDLKLPDSTVLCSEFFPHQVKKTEQFDRLVKTLNATPMRNNSIGLSCLGLLEGTISAFYKDKLKLWDIIAPLCFLKFYQNEHWDMQLHYIDEETRNTLMVDPFSNDGHYIKHLNKVNKDECRAGLLTITPKTKPELLKTILEEFNY